MEIFGSVKDRRICIYIYISKERCIIGKEGNNVSFTNRLEINNLGSSVFRIVLAFVERKFFFIPEKIPQIGDLEKFRRKKNKYH